VIIATPGGLRPAGKLRRVQGIVVPTEPRLQRHGHVDRRHHRLDQPERMVEVAHQRRAREPAHHLLGRAAHVDVDDPRALPFATMRAASAIQCASRPASCTAVAASPRPSSARARTEGLAFTMSSLATISDTTRPAPKDATSRGTAGR
jgi:hypothetical protein